MDGAELVLAYFALSVVFIILAKRYIYSGRII